MECNGPLWLLTADVFLLNYLKTETLSHIIHKMVCLIHDNDGYILQSCCMPGTELNTLRLGIHFFVTATLCRLHITDEEMRARSLSSLSVTVSVGQDLDVGSVDGTLPGDWNIQSLPLEGLLAFFHSLNPVAAQYSLKNLFWGVPRLTIYKLF